MNRQEELEEKARKKIIDKLIRKTQEQDSRILTLESRLNNLQAQIDRIKTDIQPIQTYGL